MARIYQDIFTKIRVMSVGLRREQAGTSAESLGWTTAGLTIRGMASACCGKHGALAGVGTRRSKAGAA